MGRRRILKPVNRPEVWEPLVSLRTPILLLAAVAVALAGLPTWALADYVGSVSTVRANSSIQSAGTEVLGNGGGSGSFAYKGGGNAVDAAVAAALAACVVNPGNCSLGGYGGHMMIWKAGWDGEPQLLTCIDFNSTAGSLATSNMFVGSVEPVTGNWTGPQPPANQYGWKAAGVPGTFAGLYVAQTNYGRKVSGTNYFPFAEILKPALARIANGDATGNAYYTLGSVSNLVMELYTNSPGYVDGNGQPNPNSLNDPYAVFYAGGIASDLAAAMQVNGGLVTYADMTNYRPREVAPYIRHFSCPNGTPAWVGVAPLGASGLSVLQQLAMIEALGWTNGPSGTWDSLHYWHSRGEAARLMWKDHFQWLGDPWSGVLPPDFLRNGSTDFAAQMLAHITNGYALGCPSDPGDIRLTNSLAAAITEAVDNETNVPIRVHWNDIRYGTRNISASDRWGNCVALTLSMGRGYGAQVAVTNRGLVLGQGMALFDARPGWPNSIGPGKRPVDNMSPAIVIPDYPISPTNGLIGGRPPLAVGGVGGSTIENNMATTLVKYLMEGASSSVTAPSTWLYNFEGNTIIYMRPSYPSGVQGYLGTAGLSAPGGPPSAGEVSYVQGWIPPVIVTQPAGTNVTSGSTVRFAVAATGLPLFYQWFQNGVPLSDGGTISGAQTPQLTVSAVASGAAYTVVLANGGASVTSAPAELIVDGLPAIVTQPASRTNMAGTTATFSVTAIGPGTLTYHWRKNGTNLADGGNIFGATTSQLSLNAVSSADAGTYSVTVSNSTGGVTSLGAALAVVSFTPYMAPLWHVGPLDGQPWMNTNTSFTQYAPNQRTIAYNALSNHLYVISRSSSTTSNYVVYVLNAANGAFLYTLKTNGIQCNVGKAGIGLVGISVADDGAIYACNMSKDAAGSGGTDPTSLFRVYRWANGNSNTTPALVFAGDPSGTSSALRWGDNLAVRGSGTNTQVLLDTDTAVSGNRYAAVLTPANAFMTNFSARWFTTTNFPSSLGRSLEFDGASDAIWQKRANTALVKTGFDPAASLGGAQIASSNVLMAPNFPSGLMGVGLDLTRKLAAGVFYGSDSAADTLNLYDISDLNAPVLLAQYGFPTAPRIANANYFSQTLFKNDLVFSFDANNGLMVLRLVANPAGPFLYEPFDYANIGGPVSSNTPANWTYGGSGANDLSVVSSSLSYPGLAASVGNSVTNGGAGLGVRRLFGTNFSSGALYFSALFRINDLGFGSWNGLGSVAGALTATDNTSFRLQVVVKSNSPSGYVIGTQKSGTGAATTYDTTERRAGETVFLVGKYDFTMTPNAVSLWINPVADVLGASSEPAGGSITASTGTDGFTIDRFNMRQNVASGSSSVPAAMQWDELRFGFSWAAVTPPAPPPAPVKVASYARLADGRFELAYPTGDNQPFRVFASTNLADWMFVGTAQQTAPGWFQFTDLGATSLPRRFYQMRFP
jgi:gamma-glutamyltranspeptidase